MELEKNVARNLPKICLGKF